MTVIVYKTSSKTVDVLEVDSESLLSVEKHLGKVYENRYGSEVYIGYCSLGNKCAFVVDSGDSDDM